MDSYIHAHIIYVCFFQCMQGEEKVLELMEYIGSEIAYKRGRGTKSLIPVEKNIDVKDDDIKDIVGTLPNSASILFLFFTKQEKYDVALSVMAYISCFFVFSIGYGRQFSQFLCFFSRLFGVCLTQKANK